MNKEERINEIYEKQNQKIIYLILNFNLSKTDLCKTLNLDLENLERRINSINDTELKNKIQMLLSKNNSEMSN